MKKILINGWLAFCLALGITVAVLSFQSFSEVRETNSPPSVEKAERMTNATVYKVRVNANLFIVVISDDGGVAMTRY